MNRRMAVLAGAWVLAAVVAPTWVLAQDSFSPPVTVHRVSGLQSPAEIIVDRWGIPHIYTQNFDDLFFTQGFNAARDRLWQLDLWRRRGEGLLAEAFGPSFVEQDRAARLFLYRGDMHAEWLAYASDTKRIVTAFVAGINAYIRLTHERPELLPPEFKLLDYEPGLWTPETVVRIRSHGLFRNAARELSRALFLHEHGMEALTLRDRLEPSHEMQMPEGLDLTLLSEEVLQVYRLATQGVRFPEDLKEQLADVLPRANQALTARPQAPPATTTAGTGSNNWAIAPSKSATGRAILANDPHRTLSVPSLRYIAHLSAPGLNIIGAGEPALPGISIGHNDRIAFGLTIFAIDQEDLYIYRTNPQAADEYWYRGRWEPMRVLQDVFPVRGGEPQKVTYKFTRHGPVIYEDPSRHVAVAVRAAWLEPGMAPYLGSIEYMRAQNWDEFLAAMNRWGAPSENQVYADIEGNIGWKPGGLAPIRPNWDGLLPVPGDGRYEWDGFRDMDQLPQEYNPARGWVATANQMNLPTGYPHQLSYEWSPAYRYERIHEVLDAPGPVDLAALQRLQTDYYSIPARRLVQTLQGFTPDDSQARKGFDLLHSWDFQLAPDSGAAALFELWYGRFLGPALVHRAVSNDQSAKALGSGESLWRISTVEDPQGAFLQDPVKTRNEALTESLRQAVQEAERLMGKDPESWRWDRLHHSLLEHALSALVDPETRQQWNVGPAARGGSGETVGSTLYRASDYRQVSGGSFRMVLDVANWDNSRAMNSPGQAGDPDSPHYRDLFLPWAKDESFPLLFSRTKVEQEADVRIRLEPLQ